MNSTNTSKDLLKGGGIVSASNLSAKFIKIGLKLILSNSLGVVWFGLYESVNSIVRLFSAISQVGLHHTVVRFLSAARKENDRDYAKNSYYFGLSVVVGVSLLFSFIFYFFKLPLSNLFNLNDSAGLLNWAALLLPLFALRLYFAFVYRGLKKLISQSLFNLVLHPLSLLICVAVVVIFSKDQFTLNIVFLLSILTALMIVIYGLYNNFRTFRNIFSTNGAKLFTPASMMVYSIPIWLNTVLSTSLVTIDRIMVQALSMSSEVALYSVSFSIALFITFPTNTLMPAFQPMIADIYLSKDFRQMNDVYDTILRWSAILVFLILGAIVLFGQFVLNLFGESFSTAYPVLLVLAIAEGFNALAGPAGFILNMCDKQKEATKILITGVGFGIVLNAILIPILGAFGAAIGTGLSWILISGLRLAVIKKYFMIQLDYLRLGKILVLISCLVFPLLILSVSFNINAMIIFVFYTISSFLLLSKLMQKNEKQMVLNFIRKIIQR